jgi:hypothetical protein
MITSKATDEIVKEIFTLYKNNPIRATIRQFQMYVDRRTLLEQRLFNSIIQDYKNHLESKKIAKTF